MSKLIEVNGKPHEKNTNFLLVVAVLIGNLLIDFLIHMNSARNENW